MKNFTAPTENAMLRSNQQCRLLVLLLTMFTGFVVTGCHHEESRGRISGWVTFRGQPVSDGIVLFSNTTKGVYMTANLKPDGSYEVTTAKGAGLPTGQYQVCVCPPLVNGTTGAGPAPKAIICRNIPEKYRTIQTSGLALVVKEGENQFDVAM
jgi:hypothetical protein